MSDQHNPAGAVRDEDAVDVGALHGWLRANTDLDLPQVEPTLQQFRGGASNLTYRLDYPDRQLIMRRPPHGHKAASAHDMGREVRVQRSLRPHFPLVPQIHGYCTDTSVLGSEFYVMEYLEGSILRGELPHGVNLSAEQTTTLANTVIDALAELHRVQSADLAEMSRGPGYVSRQISGWSKRYRDARTDDVPDGEAVMAWLDSHQPPDRTLCLIHGDWRFDNMVLDLAQPSIVGVLDWEMSTIGDPLMDIGASLAYWVQADDDPAFLLLRRQPTHLPGMPTRDAFVERYAQQSGLVIDDWRFYEVYGVFRLAVIIQQIWFRYRRGETTNPAFAQFGLGVNVLMERARSRLTES
jgi:aminoglycoside phosphotransferase (APT) family kinase protein